MNHQEIQDLNSIRKAINETGLFGDYVINFHPVVVLSGQYLIHFIKKQHVSFADGWERLSELDVLTNCLAALRPTIEEELEKAGFVIDDIPYIAVTCHWEFKLLIIKKQYTPKG